jgi:hypothetical protein
MRLTIKEIFELPPDGRPVSVKGWIRTKRGTKAAVFLEVNDGSRMGNIQCVFDEAGAVKFAAELARAGTGASVAVEGSLIPSPASGQKLEVKASSLTVIGEAPPESYPLQKKAHSMEFLREIAHLRPRTNTFGAVARVRNRMAFAVHQFFQERGFNYVHTPLITTSDAEGAGEMFQVTTLDLDRIAKSGEAVDYSKDFFGKAASLTVSGQLNVETYCQALSRVYTFGPLAYIAYKAARNQAAVAVATLLLLFLPLLVGHGRSAVDKLCVRLEVLGSPAVLKGMHVSPRTAKMISDASDRLEPYLAAHPQTPILVESPDALWAVFARNRQNPGPFYIARADDKDPAALNARLAFIDKARPVVFDAINRGPILDHLTSPSYAVLDDLKNGAKIWVPRDEPPAVARVAAASKVAVVAPPAPVIMASKPQPRAEKRR